MKRPIFLFFLLGALVCREAAAQNYIMSNNPITDCDGTFFDPGGPTGNYGNNQNFTTTICAGGGGGTHVRLSFSGADLASGDLLCFYDGPNASAPLLSCSDDYSPGSPFVVQASAVNPSGCLTVVFTSNGGGTATGWSAVISCEASCQQVLAELISTTPAAVPADTGWIDVCPGERIFFNGQGNYPQNNFAYAQSDLTTTFEWNFGDGGIAYGPNTSHRFDEPGGYYVQLILTDILGCRSTNLINQRVRVAPAPDFSLVTAPGAICAGDSIALSAGVQDSTGSETIVVMPNAVSFAVQGSRSDSLAVPDGTGIPYETSIYFTEFSPGQTLTNPDDLLSICVNMEHSWMRDIEISLTCPNGQSIILHDHPGNFGSQVFLGDPNDNDVFTPIPGSGYDYCWTNNAPNGTWIEYANNELPIIGGTIPAGDYSPFDPISDLIGCPLNGEWTITVTDWWAIDNGFIFSWGINFEEFLYPNIETFEPQFTSWGWNNHPSIFASTAETIEASPQNAGTAGYLFTVTDEFGCSWTTPVNVPVLPPTHPDCHACDDNFAVLQDAFVCAGEGVMLDGSFLGQTQQEIRFESYPDYAFGNGNHPHNNPYAAPIAVSSLGYNTLNSPLTQIASICIDIETDFDADLNIYLRAPDGKTLELSTGNGGGGDNYKITCFSPTAVTPVVGQSAPFNGTYIPEGNWANLNNAQVNGDWELRVSDGFGLNQLGKLKWWSITFNVPTTVNYSWTNAATLSCNNCPTPTAVPSGTTTYILTATDNFNCVHRDTAVVQVVNVFPAPTNLISTLGPGQITWTWLPVPGATDYEVSVNAGPWQPASGGASHTVGGLMPGDMLSLQVRVAGGSPSCPAAVAVATATYFACTLSATLNSTTPARCYNTATGSASINVANSNGPSQFFADGAGPAFSNGNIANYFAAGPHFVVVVDSAGCRDTVGFSITQPNQLIVDAVATDVLCFGDDNGAVTANVTGGTSGYSYVWQSCLGTPAGSGPTLNNLTAGCYQVTITDANNCTATDSDTISEPAAFVLSPAQDSVNCFGASDGAATITVLSGGVPGFSYLWDNMQQTQTATGLDAGFHAVTVTDANNCQAVTLVQVLEPPQLALGNVTTTPVACFGQSNGTASVAVSGGTPAYLYYWSNTNTDATATGLGAGAVSVTVTDFRGCTAVGSAVINTPTALTAQTTGVANEQCAGACNGSISIVVNGGTSPYDFHWNNPSVPDGTQTASNLCPGNYAVTVTDDSGCTQLLNATVQAAVPIALSIAVTPPLCAGDANGVLTANAGGGAPPFQTLWSDNSGSPALSNYTCGQTYAVTVTDANNCTATQTLAEAPCPPVLEIKSIVPTPTLCFGEANGHITVSAEGGTGTLEYLWSDPNQQFAPTAENLAAGPYTVTVTDANNCTTTATATVTQPAALTATVAPTAARCFGESSGSALAQPSGGTPSYNFTWNVPQTGPQISGLPAGTYFVTVTDANGCIFAGASATVGQPATVVQATVSQSYIACFGENENTATVVAAGGNGAPFSYVWNDNQTSATAVNLDAGLSYSVTASDALGCTAVQSIELSERDSIAVNAAFTLPSCNGSTDGQAAVNFISGGVGGGVIANYNYQWNAPGFPVGEAVSGLMGGQAYTLTATDAQGCTGIYAFSLPEPPEVLVVLAPDAVSCFGFTDGSVTVTQVQSTQPVTGYNWSNSGAGQQIADLPAGIYTVTVTNANGCTGTATAEVSEPEALRVAFDAETLKCSGDSNAVIAATVAGGTPAYDLQWSNGSQNATLDQLPAGMYVLTITDVNACELVDSLEIVSPAPLALQTETVDVICFGQQNGRFKVAVTGGTQPYRYALDNGPFGGSSTFIQVPPGTHTVTVRDANGCTNTASDTIRQPLPVEVFIGNDTTILFGDAIVLTADVANAVGLTDYLWSSALTDSLTCQDTLDCISVSVQPAFANVYRLLVTDENGCRGEARIRVEVEKPRGIFVPTGFTPNDDLANDLLVVYGKTRTVRQVTNFRVFDRWGELVWEDRDLPVNVETRGWNGQFRGQPCEPGVYVWTAEVEYLDGFVENVAGQTTLIR